LRELYKDVYTTDSIEDVRYRAEIDTFFSELPPDPTDIWSSFVKNVPIVISNAKSINEIIKDAKKSTNEDEMKRYDNISFPKTKKIKK
jgi:hypothetical protein